jgi:hypothetical protein
MNNLTSLVNKLAGSDNQQKVTDTNDYQRELCTLWNSSCLKVSKFGHRYGRDWSSIYQKTEGVNID